MRVIIGGAGRVGSELARAMRAETMDVVLIDNDSRAVKNAQSLDALVIHGDITSRSALQEAGIGDASVFVAVTDSDDRNLIACALAEDEFKSKNGSSVQHNLLSIGRFRDRNYVDEHNQGHLSRWAAVDYAIDPVDGAIQRLATGLRSSAIEEVIPFGHEAYIIELNVTKDAEEVIYQTLAEASLGIEGGLPLIVGVKRDGEPSTVPNKDFTLMPKDRIAVATSGLGSFSRILTAFGHESIDFPAQPRVAIIGATDVGRRIAENWLRNGAYVTVIERNLNTANDLSGSDIGAHANLDVIHGDFLDRNILTEIGMKEHHIAIAALEDDHISIAAALLANDMGVTRTGLILKDSDLVTVTQRMGITFAVDIKRVAVDNILAHIHTKASGAYAILSNIPDVVGISQTVSKDSKYAGKKVGNSGLPEWSRIAFIQRRNTSGFWETLRPAREKTIVEGDRLILFCRPDRVADLEKRFKV